MERLFVYLLFEHHNVYMCCLIVCIWVCRAINHRIRFAKHAISCSHSLRLNAEYTMHCTCMIFCSATAFCNSRQSFVLTIFSAVAFPLDLVTFFLNMPCMFFFFLFAVALHCESQYRVDAEQQKTETTWIELMNIRAAHALLKMTHRFVFSTNSLLSLSIRIGHV